MLGAPACEWRYAAVALRLGAPAPQIGHAAQRVGQEDSEERVEALGPGLVLDPVDLHARRDRRLGVATCGAPPRTRDGRGRPGRLPPRPRKSPIERESDGGGGVVAGRREGRHHRTAVRRRSFDLILCSHVLEHVADDQTAMREMARVLKPGGLVIVPLARQLRPGRHVRGSVGHRSRCGCGSSQDEEGGLVPRSGSDHAVLRVTARRPGGELRVDAVLPVGKNRRFSMAASDCLATQTAAVDEVIVVDDSPQGDVEQRPGVRMLRSGGRGPYAARNVGWRASEADIVLFLDLRSRPRPDWARRLVEAFEEPAVALASSDVLVTGGPSLGARVGKRHRFFRRERYTRDGLFRPYAPTCNLGVRRDALVAADGFREVRSSADMDLCWRILADPRKRLVSLPEVLMEWVARDRLRDYFEQCYRYGKAHQPLYAEWARARRARKAPFATWCSSAWACAWLVERHGRGSCAVTAMR